MALIPENTIEDILSRIDIVELIAGYLPLKHAGRNYKALCPFHSEKTPSFVVNPERQIFHCFGCAAGGNAIGFLMQYERLQFPEAVEALAKKAGVSLPESSYERQLSPDQNMLTRLYEVNGAAAVFYCAQLYSPQGKAALTYLEKRGISRDAIQKFKIGYAPQQWDGLFTSLRNKNYALALLEKAGLVIPKEAGGYYDRFRGRLIVPIVDTKERIVAFGARVLPASSNVERDQGLPKYINSPETPIYTKSKILFGLHAAFDAIRHNDAVIIVEGYFDCIMPYQAGIAHIVASCGTALTVEQVRLLKRYTHNVVMIYDADNAGQMATLRSLDILLEEDMQVKVVRLPEGYDPDSYVRHFGGHKFQELVAQAKDIFDYKLERLQEKYSPLTILHKVKIASEMLHTIRKFNNIVMRSAYIKKLAEKLSLDESALLAELKKVKTDTLSISRPNTIPLAMNPFLTSLPTERLLVRLLLEEQELIEALREKITPEDFRDKYLGKIVSKMFELFCNGKKADAKSLLNDFSDPHVSKIICELTACDGPSLADKDKILHDCIRRMKEDMRKLKQQEICEKMKLAEVQNDEHRLKELLEEFQYLSRKGG